MKRLVATLVLSIGMTAMGYADDDPMVSLFKFQSQMAAQGSVEAIMKLGEMYEQGQGTKRNLDKALEMYKKAEAQGNADAVKAIRRIEKAKKQGLHKLELERKRKLAKEKAAREKAMRAKAARDEAMRRKAEREKIMRKKAAMEKAAREKMAKEKIAKEKVEREKAAREKAAREKAAREKAIKARRQREPVKDLPGMGWDEEDEGEDDESSRINPANENPEPVVIKEKPVVTKTDSIAVKTKPADKNLSSVAIKANPAAKKLKPAENVKSGGDDEGFTSNPCDTPAGRFMATCRNRQ